MRTVRFSSNDVPVKSTAGSDAGLVSIIVATRGDRPALRDALQSVRVLSGILDVEVIILCPQTTPLVVSAAQAVGANLVIEPDTGLYDAWNRGIARSAGQVIGFLNDDDRYLPGAVEVARLALAGVDIAVGGARVVDGGAVLCEIRPFSLQDRRFVVGVPSAINRTFIRRELFSKARIGAFNSSLRIAGDKDWVARLVLEGGYSESLVNALAYEYSQHGESLTYHGNLPSETQTRERLAVFASLARGSRTRLSPQVWLGGALAMSIQRHFRAASQHRGSESAGDRLAPRHLLLMMLWFIVEGWRLPFTRRRVIRAGAGMSGSHD